MGRKHRPRVPHPEGIPAPKAVPGNPEPLYAQLITEVLHRGGDPPVDDLLVVLREELVHRPARLVEVRGRGGAGEEIRGDGEVAGPREGVGEARGVSLGGLRGGAPYSLFSASWMPKTSVR